MKKFVSSILSFLMILIASLSFCACKEDGESNSFDFNEAKLELETMDTCTIAFLNNLKLKNSTDETLSVYVEFAKGYVLTAKSLLKSWNLYINELNNEFSEEQEEINNSIAETSSSYRVDKDGEQIEFKLSKDKKFFSAVSKKTDHFVCVEYAKFGEYNYAVQLVVTSSDADQYDIIQIYFNGYEGTFVVDNYCNIFASIYDTEVTGENYPNTNGDYKYTN